MALPASARSALLGVVGLCYGALLAVAEMACLPLAGAALATRARGRALAGAERFAELERVRLARFFALTGTTACGGERAVRYLAIRWMVGVLGAGILLLIAWGVATGVVLSWQLVTDRPLGGGDPADARWWEPFGLVVLGVLLLFLAVQGLLAVARLDCRLARRFLAPSPEELLRRRLSRLATTRAQVIEAVNGERRRIERDLHDGVQQRLVALGMLLGRARRAPDPERAHALLEQAHDESRRTLADLRDVTWRVYPPALDPDGLPAALESLAERSTVPVTLSCALLGRLDPAVETAAYFVASEAVTNAVKHADPSRIDVVVRETTGSVRVEVSDDGSGGANPLGGGLSGLARRVAAADGAFTVHSPSGGPTVVVAELPCG